MGTTILLLLLVDEVGFKVGVPVGLVFVFVFVLLVVVEVVLVFVDDIVLLVPSTAAEDEVKDKEEDPSLASLLQDHKPSQHPKHPHRQKMKTHLHIRHTILSCLVSYNRSIWLIPNLFRTRTFVEVFFSGVLSGPGIDIDIDVGVGGDAVVAEEKVRVGFVVVVVVPAAVDAQADVVGEVTDHEDTPARSAIPDGEILLSSLL